MVINSTHLLLPSPRVMNVGLKCPNPNHPKHQTFYSVECFFSNSFTVFTKCDYIGRTNIKNNNQAKDTLFLLNTNPKTQFNPLLIVSQFTKPWPK